MIVVFFVSSRRRLTRSIAVTRVQTCALPSSGVLRRTSQREQEEENGSRGTVGRRNPNNAGGDAESENPNSVYLCVSECVCVFGPRSPSPGA